MTRSPALAKIHIAKKELRLSDEDYRAILTRVAGVTSSAQLGPEGHKTVLAEFQRLGFKVKTAPPGGKSHVQKVRDLWAEAASKGIVKNGSEEALRAFVARQTRTDATPNGVSAVQFLNATQATKVIEGLKAMIMRAKRLAP